MARSILLILMLVSLLLTSCRGTRSELNSFVNGSGGIKKLKVIPSRGSTVFVTEVTIIGSGFESESINVFVGDETCKNIEVVNDEQINCSLNPQAAGSYDVIVSKSGSSSEKVENGFKFINPVSATGEAPTLDSVSEASGPATLTKSITINGSNFVDGVIVKIATNLATVYCTNVVVATDKNSLTCNTPVLTPTEAASITGTSDIIIQNPDGQKANLLDGYSFNPPPAYSSIGLTGGVTAPPLDGVFSNNGAIISMSIIGSNFVADLTVEINGKAATSCTQSSVTQINCTSLPNQATNITGAYSLVITNPDGQSVMDSLTLVGRSIISGVSPEIAAVSGGTALTFSGDNISSVIGSPAPSITFRNSINSGEIGVCTVTSATDPINCNSPNTTTARDIIIRYINSYGYLTDYSNFSSGVPAKLHLTWQDSFEGDGSNFIGKTALGSTFRLVGRIYNLSNVLNITNMSVDDTAFTNNGFSYDPIGSNCGATLDSNAFCELHFTYSSNSLNPELDSGNVIVNFHNGQAADSFSFNMINAWTAPMRALYKSKDFGDIPHGNNHSSQPARHSNVWQIYNPTKTEVTININSSSFTGSAFSYSGGSFPGTHSSSKVQSYACPSSGIIPAKTKCVISIDYTPTTSGDHAGSYSLVYNTNQTLSLALSGSSTNATSTNCNPTGSTGFGGGDGSSGNPFLICSKQHFEDLSDYTIADNTDPYSYRDKFYLQTADIDLANPAGGEIEAVQLHSGDIGHFNGGGFQLKNYSWQSGGNDRAPFYSSGIYENIQMVDVNILAGERVGGIAANGKNSSFVNCYATGEIESTGVTGKVGGLVGYFDTSTSTAVIDKSYFIGDINSAYTYAGGIVGFLNFHSLDISNVYAMGEFTSAASYIGGIIGGSSGDDSQTINISNVHSAVNISQLASYGAGFVSHSVNTNLNIIDSEYSGELLVNGSYVAGAVNYASSSVVNISRFAMTGSVTGLGSNGGGICSNCGSTTISESYVSGSVYVPVWYSGGIAYNATNVTDTFVIGDLNLSHFTGGMVGFSTNLSNSYIASYPYTYINNDVRAGYWTSTNPSNLFYLTGSSIDVAQPGLVSRTAAEMSSSLPGITENTDVWKYAPSGYTFPIFNWMADDFIP